MLVETTYRRYQASTWRFWILPERIRTMNISPSHVLFRHSTPPSNVIFSPGLMFDSVLLSSIPRFYNFQTPSLIVPVSRFDLQWKFEGDKIGSCCSRWKNKFNKILERLNGKILNSNEINNPSATGRQQVAENWNGAPAHEHWQNVTRKKWKGWRRKWRLPENNRHLWKCDVCDVVMNGVKQVLDHLRGRTHARKSRQSICRSLRQRSSEVASSIGHDEGKGQFVADGSSPQMEARSQAWSPVNSDTPIRICCFQKQAKFRSLQQAP